MPKAATEVVQDILFAAVVDAIAALRAASKGVPNTLLRDIQAVHPNTTFADLPKELQDAIAASVRSAFTKLLAEGYAVSPSQGPPLRSPASTGERSGQRPPPRSPQGPRSGPKPAGVPRGRPGGKPRR